MKRSRIGGDLTKYEDDLTQYNVENRIINYYDAVSYTHLLPVWLHPFISMLPITGPSIDGQSVFISDR